MQVGSTDNIHLSRSDTFDTSLPHGFQFSEDRKSAYKIVPREIEGETRDVTFKVNFRENEPYKHLEQFNDSKVNYLLDQSIELGLGKKFTDVSMTRTGIIAEKRNGNIKYLDKYFYDKKIKSTDDIAKKQFFEKNKEITQHLKYAVHEVVPETEYERKLRLEAKKNKNMPESKTAAKKEYAQNEKKLKNLDKKLKEVEKKKNEALEPLKDYYIGDEKLIDLIRKYDDEHPGCSVEEGQAYFDKLMQSDNLHLKE
jgi:hypothetical protein